MHTLDDYQVFSRTFSRTAGKPVAIFDDAEARRLFSSYPFALPFIGREPRGYELTGGFEVKPHHVGGMDRLLTDLLARTPVLLLGVIEATPYSMTIGTFVSTKSAGALTDAEFFDGEDPLQPIVG